MWQALIATYDAGVVSRVNEEPKKGGKDGRGGGRGGGGGESRGGGGGQGGRRGAHVFLHPFVR